MDRRLEPDDGHAAAILYQAYRHRSNCHSREKFLESAKRWDLAYMMCGDQVMGVAARMDGAIHIGVIEAWRRRWATMGFMKMLTNWASKNGVTRTGVADDNKIGHRLALLAGYTPLNVEPGGREYAHYAK